MTNTSDILIVGAGLIGTACAISLQKLGFSIHILDNHLSDIITPSQKNARPISLSYGSYRLLNALGVWKSLAPLASPILAVHVSEQGKFGRTRFSAAEQHVPALGYVVPFNALQSALHHHAVTQPTIQFKSITDIKRIQRDTNGAHLETSDNQSYDATLLIASDGAESTCRRLLGISYDETTSGDTAHIYQLTLSEAHQHTAYERFTTHGIVAALPLHDTHRAQVVWTITPRASQYVASWNDNKTRTFFQELFEGRLSISDAKKITQFTLQTKIASIQATESAVLLGNAAHTIYPVAAQGFNLGLHDVAILYDTLLNATEKKQRIGDLSVLKTYETAVKQHQEKIYRITNQLIGLFELPCIGSSRAMGLLATDILTPIKNKLAKRTMGIAEKLSRLLQDNHT